MSRRLRFLAAPPGLDPFVDFSLDGVDGADGLYSLRSLDDESLRLFLLDASLHLADYSPRLSDGQRLALDLETADRPLVLVVATPRESGTTMNLMAPIVINATTGTAAQVILDDQDWPIRAELAVRRA
ncbi:MAG TPA: flagellar assembly protein FliW [Lacisediminihabitans sp.]|uniref:flagellar assembly protein FliW n=1 Tax=Lacisediminihabitans sp. TaxID=2787631 RepID=UPI002ED8BDE5